MFTKIRGQMFIHNKIRGQNKLGQKDKKKLGEKETDYKRNRQGELRERETKI